MRRRLTKPEPVESVHHVRTRYYFWSKVDRKGPEECWPWTGAMGGGGKQAKYPRVKLHDGGIASAHRISWEIANNELLGDRMALHRCDNSQCVNPGHLYAGTRADNTRDAIERGRMTGMREKVTGPKLTETDVYAIRVLAEEGETQASIARQFGVSDRAIRGILKGETWAGKGVVAARSSTVEQAAHNGSVAGSTPAARTTEQSEAGS